MSIKAINITSGYFLPESIGTEKNALHHLMPGLLNKKEHDQDLPRTCSFYL
jgi:hypothetical protein